MTALPPGGGAAAEAAARGGHGGNDDCMTLYSDSQMSFENLCAKLQANRDDEDTPIVVCFGHNLISNPGQLPDGSGALLGLALVGNTRVYDVRYILLHRLFPNYNHNMMRTPDDDPRHLLEFIRGPNALRRVEFCGTRETSLDVQDELPVDDRVTLRVCQAIGESSSIEEVEFRHNVSGDAVCHLMSSTSLKILTMTDNQDAISEARLQERALANGRSKLESLSLGRLIHQQSSTFILRSVSSYPNLLKLSVNGGQTASYDVNSQTEVRHHGIGVPIRAVCDFLHPNHTGERRLEELHLTYYHIEGTAAEDLVNGLLVTPTLSILNFELCSCDETAKEHLVRYMNQEVPVVSAKDAVAKDASTGLHTLDLYIDDISDIPWDTSFDIARMLRPPPDPLNVGTFSIGSRLQSLSLKGIGRDSRGSLSQFFTVLGKHAYRIHLNKLTLDCIDSSSVPAFLESLPKWMHLTDLKASVHLGNVMVKTLVEKLSQNGSLHKCSIRLSSSQARGFRPSYTELEEAEKKKIASYCERNRRVRDEKIYAENQNLAPAAFCVSMAAPAKGGRTIVPATCPCAITTGLLAWQPSLDDM